MTLGRRTAKDTDSRIITVEDEMMKGETKAADGWRWEADWKCGVIWQKWCTPEQKGEWAVRNH